MSTALKRCWAVTTAALLLGLAPPEQVNTLAPDGGCRANGRARQGATSASVGCGPTPQTVPEGTAPTGPKCQWTVYLGTRPAIDAIGGVPMYRDTTSKADVAEPGVGVETLYRVECADGVSYRWAAPSEFVDRQALINAVRDDAVASIPLPALVMSPAPDVGGVVNLGLWLAVDAPGQVNAYAEVGPVWASVTARFVGMTWDMGNGDVVNCDGPGVPYPEGSNLIEQGPCGYTYTEQPPADGYSVIATGHWQVQLVTSFGDNRALDPIDMPYTFAYDVDELVTTGVG